jgi:hypothetical protein
VLRSDTHFRAAVRSDVSALVRLLTSDKLRPDAIRFYESLGFAASHEGMKLHLPRPGDEVR